MPGEFPHPTILCPTDKLIYRAPATRAPPEALHATRVKPQNPFFPPEPHQFDLSVHPSPLPWGNSPPDRSPSDGQVYLMDFQTPAPVTRVSRPGNHRPARPRRPALSPMGEFPALARAAREAPVGQGGPDRDARHAPHGREGQRKKEGVYTLPSAHVRTRMRAPARLYEKENYSKTTCCRPP